MTSAELAQLIVVAAADRRARDVVTIDLAGKTTIADYFVICEGDTDRQVRAIVDSIEEACGERGVRPLGVAGMKDASWACIDFDAVIAHVFLPGERTFYDLESLWEATAERREEQGEMPRKIVRRRASPRKPG
jgi:ribosome-associated protein